MIDTSHSLPRSASLALLLAQLLALTACVSTPTGPSVLALPGTGKSFDQFRGDDMACRQFAQSQLGTTPNEVGVQSGATSAAVGTLLGAAAGAAADGGHGAGVGAGAGLAMGGLVGSGTAQTASDRSQQRYDFGYVQCMYAKGHRVPVYGRLTEARPAPPPPPTAPAPGSSVQ